MDKRINQLKQITATQRADGNWNYNSYMHGMANGMELALATMEGREPDYLAAPQEWLADRKEGVCWKLHGHEAFSSNPHRHVDGEIVYVCRKCPVCEGQDHHWLYQATEEKPEGWMACKHCPAIREVRDDDE